MSQWPKMKRPEPVANPPPGDCRPNEDIPDCIFSLYEFKAIENKENSHCTLPSSPLDVYEYVTQQRITCIHSVIVRANTATQEEYNTYADTTRTARIPNDQKARGNHPFARPCLGWTMATESLDTAQSFLCSTVYF